MTPVQYIERRLNELKCERPTSESGRAALRVVIAELEMILYRLKLDALTQLHSVIREEFNEVEH